MLQHVTDEQRSQAGWIGGEGVRLLLDGASVGPPRLTSGPPERARAPAGWGASARAEQERDARIGQGFRRASSTLVA
jgi:hypothetical protein